MMRSIALTFVVLICILTSVGKGWGADYFKGMEAFDNGDFATALRELTPLAERGDRYAQFRLAWMYDDGLGVPQDYKTAIKWYTRSAELGYSTAQSTLASKYRWGSGVTQDYKIALKWYTLLAEQGSGRARYSLGEMYRMGQGGPGDIKTAIKWYTLAAEKGHSDAALRLGSVYEFGEDSYGEDAPQDYEVAANGTQLLLKKAMHLPNSNWVGCTKRAKVSHKTIRQLSSGTPLLPSRAIPMPELNSLN